DLMSRQHYAPVLVPADVPVDRLVTDAQRTVLLKRPRDLFRTPFAADQPRHSCHVSGTETCPATTSATPRHGVAVRLLRAVVTVVVGRMATQLAYDGAAISPQHTRHLSRRVAAHPLCRNQVLFFLGELV